jgi:hypothetical protein
LNPRIIGEARGGKKDRPDEMIGYYGFIGRMMKDAKKRILIDYREQRMYVNKVSISVMSMKDKQIDE